MFSSPKRGVDTSLKAQFEQQSQQFAELLSTLQKVTVELEDEKESKQKQIAEATKASEAAAAAAEAQSAEIDEQMGAMRNQHEEEVAESRCTLLPRPETYRASRAVAGGSRLRLQVRELSELLAQVQQQWSVKKEQYEWLSAEITRRGGASVSVANGASPQKSQITNGNGGGASSVEVQELRRNLDEQKQQRQRAEAALAEREAAAAAERDSSAAAAATAAAATAAVATAAGAMAAAAMAAAAMARRSSSTRVAR